MDFMQMVDAIFQKKNNYKTATDEDKINNFYMVNKKFSLGKLDVSQFFNHKSMDKASAMDLWFLYFRKTTFTPGWYWSKNPNPKTKEKKVPKADKEMIIEYEGLTEKEFDFLYENYQDDVEYKIKLLKRLE